MRRRGAVVLVVGLLMAGCAGQTASDSGYHLREGAIDGADRLTVDEASVLHVSNVGVYSHTLVVTDIDGTVIGATGLVGPGEETTLEVDLAPGRYVFSCRIVSQDEDGNLIDHFEQGMHREVTVLG